MYNSQYIYFTKRNVTGLQSANQTVNKKAKT